MFHRKTCNWIFTVLKVTFKSVGFLLELVNDMLSWEPLRFRQRPTCNTYTDNYIPPYFWTDRPWSCHLSKGTTTSIQKNHWWSPVEALKCQILCCSREGLLSDSQNPLLPDPQHRWVILHSSLSVPPVVILPSFLLAASLIKAHLLHVLISAVVAP